MPGMGLGRVAIFSLAETHRIGRFGHMSAWTKTWSQLDRPTPATITLSHPKCCGIHTPFFCISVGCGDLPARFSGYRGLRGRSSQHRAYQPMETPDVGARRICACPGNLRSMCAVPQPTIRTTLIWLCFSTCVHPVAAKVGEGLVTFSSAVAHGLERATPGWEKGAFGLALAPDWDQTASPSDMRSGVRVRKMSAILPARASGVKASVPSMRPPA